MTDDILGIYQYYGLHQPYFEDGVNHVFAKYDVVAMRVAFCVVNDSLRSSVQLNNERLFEALSKAYPGFREDRLQDEIQQSSKTAATLNTIMRKRLSDRIKQLHPRHYIYIKWREDGIEGRFLVDVFVNLYETNQRDRLLWHLKITPATEEVLIKDANGKWNENSITKTVMMNHKPFKLTIADADYAMALIYHFILTEHRFEIIFKGGVEGEKDSTVFKLDVIPDSILKKLATIDIGHLEEKYMNPCISDGSQLKVTWDTKDYSKTIRLSNYYQPDIALLIEMVNSLAPEKYRIWYDKTNKNYKSR